MPDQPDKPGAAPQAPMPWQPSGSMQVGPWIYPHPPSPPPPETPKKDEHGGIKLAIQIIMATLALGGVVWSGGSAFEKLRHIDENQRAADARAAEQTRRQDERDEKFERWMDRFGRKVDGLAEQVTQARSPRRRREAVRGIDTAP